jgi:hypothetical protein
MAICAWTDALHVFEPHEMPALPLIIDFYRRDPAMLQCNMILYI